jgi:hypothetical protein
MDLNAVGNPDSPIVPLRLQGRHTVTDAGTTRVGLKLRLGTSGSDNFCDLLTGVHLQVLRLRAT